MPFRFHIMKRAIATLLLALATVASGKPRVEFRDFSQKGPDYRPLENVRLAADDVTYAGSEQIEILGKSYLAIKYSMVAKIRVQTLCAIGTVNTEVYETFPANFDILVVDDKSRILHDSYVHSMYALWSRKELYSGEWYFDFGIKDDRYVIAAMPDLVDKKGFYFIWVNGRVIKFVFNGFRDKDAGGWGVMDSFTSDNLRIRIGDAEFRAYQYPLSARKKFLKLYRAGFFRTA